MNVIIPRTPWPENFPDVVVHHSIKTRNNHPDYAMAKAGDAAAQVLAVALLTDDKLDAVRRLVGASKPLVVPVAAKESGGFNAIPDAMAQVIAVKLGLPMAAYDLQQSGTVAHTRAHSWHRLVTAATFTGTVTPGADYLLVDDHVGFGGTLANLRGYLETHGGHVLGMTTLTETGGASKITPRPATLAMLEAKHGNELEQF